jgi:hypothetical protein
MPPKYVSNVSATAPALGCPATALVSTAVSPAGIVVVVVESVVSLLPALPEFPLLFVVSEPLPVVGAA